MGREVRMVPPNWQHPLIERYGRKDKQPMFDRDFSVAKKMWIEGLMSWENKTHPDFEEHGKEYEFWEWEGDPPDPKYYRPWKDDEATWYQVWETVSEGTPVTPPFEKREELVEYLIKHGDEWDQKRGEGGWSRKSAENFVMGDGWRPTIIMNDQGIKTARDMEEF